jgi:diguanylate cyclase (GGDEF)-like protein/PAS domain S-box-containing protein
MGVADARPEVLDQAVARVIAWFQGEDPWGEGGLTEALSSLGEAAGADRVHIFQNLRGPDGRLWMDLRGEWDAPGIRSIFDDPGNHLHPYFPDFAGWIEPLSAGEAVDERTADMPPERAQVLANERTVGVFLVPVMLGADFWGYVGLDDCGTGVGFTDDARSAVRLVARTVADAVLRERRAEDATFQDDRYRSLVEQGPAITYVDATDDLASSLFVSPQMTSLLGYTQEEWVSQPDLWPRILHPDDRVRALAENARHNETGEPFRLEYRMFSKDGRIVWVHDQATMIRDGRGMPRYSIGVMMDVTDRKRSEEQVAFQTYHDELTGLPSRAMFEELLELSVARARRHDGAVAVLCVDVDDFRLVNDSLGHQAGDALLRLVADRLREATRETDLVARRGGDQFLLLLADLDHEVASEIDAAAIRAESVAQRIAQSMAAPFQLDGQELYVSASVGISLFPKDADDPGTLQRNAEAAMYDAKKGGSSGYAVSSRGAFDSTAKLQFVTRLRKAVESQRWTLYYQPVLELDSGTMVGVEALIRWIEPDGTMVPPAEFIPLAEELGLIEQIGDWVVRELVYQVQAWRDLGIELEVGFNLSPRQFWQPDLADRIVSQIGSGGIDPSRVLVEITESSAMMDPERAMGILWGLHDAGLRIAIDDFGTGYSSLSRLREMPVNVLKIDRSFVSNVHDDPQAASIVSAFLELSRGLGMTTLAEGIETADELSFLRDRACMLGQGFYFSKPVPPEEIIAFALGGLPAADSMRVV